MKKFSLLAGILCLTFACGCGESVDSPDAHICGHFYETVGSSDSQTQVATGDVLSAQHKTYAITLSATITPSGISTTRSAKVSIPVTSTGTLIVATTNLESSFSLQSSGGLVTSKMNEECDVAQFNISVTQGSTVELTVTSERAEVLLVYEII